MAAKIREIQHFFRGTTCNLGGTGFKICSWQENDFWEKLPVDEYVFLLIFTQKLENLIVN